MAAWPQPADADTLRICVATDTHIGYMGKDNVRKNDALNTFEEVLQICRGSSADLILHGGDLFHENKPQRGCLYNAMELLRRYCLGPGDVGFQVVSGPEMFRRGLVNYEDPNMNVDMPMFMIHGNHDDPGGDSNLSVANLLEVASLVNYFGRAENLENIVVKPVLLQKGQTRVAIFGVTDMASEISVMKDCTVLYKIALSALRHRRMWSSGSTSWCRTDTSPESAQGQQGWRAE
ncbi:unnamed protein product [Prorocentrum cordatum]|uniref:Calcineurin-like phosphoesterase domain-containing protein n=1 Tax=Prorocentrum cordatum TaxID=2364126 RepID=A0ABN9PMI7_9DINO|nr:unnamed protein product [Polarella glacialis]